MWRVYKASGRPWPVLCPDDDVLDYMVMEAVFIRAQQEDQKAQEQAEKDQERKQWKKDNMKSIGRMVG